MNTDNPPRSSAKVPVFPMALFAKAFLSNHALSYSEHPDLPCSQDILEKHHIVASVGNISHATLFINGNEMPGEYSVEDLKEVLG